MRDAINAAFARFREDEDAWVAIVTGAGRSFCAGADMADAARRGGRRSPGTFWERPTVNSFESGWEIFKPVIAAVNGHCLGYGLTLVTWCDFVVAADDAEFGFPEVTVGMPTIVGALRLPQRLGWQRGHGAAPHRRADRRPRGPRRSGWPAGWCPATNCWPRPARLADRLLAAAPLAARATKEMAVRGPHLPPTEAIRFGETMRRVAAATEDAAEGIAAFREKRPPVWRGR